MRWRSILLVGGICGILSTGWVVASVIPKNLSTSHQPHPSKHHKETTIRVRIYSKLTSFSLRGWDLQWQGTGAERLKSTSSGLAQWNFECGSGSMKASTAGKTVEIQSDIILQPQAGFVSLQNRPFREKLRIYPDEDGCEVINLLSLERYLDGVVNSEINAQWEKAAIEAQVIAARSYAYARIIEAHKRKAHYDVESDLQDQLYQGSAKEDYRVAQAIEKTRGKILTIKGRQAIPIQAFYHSNCGGHTELPHYVWGVQKPGFSKRIRCPYCKSASTYEWSLSLPESEIRQKILLAVTKDKPPVDWPEDWQAYFSSGQILEFKTGNRAPSGRILEIKLTLSSELTPTDENQLLLPKAYSKPQKKVFSLSGNQFRRYLGTQVVRSTLFKSRFSENILDLLGQGYGHGVGLCQWGAKKMAEKGQSANQILSFYYPETQVRNAPRDGIF